MPKALCSQCKGRRVVFDPISLLLSVGLPIALLVESGSDHGVTKRECPTCEGRGYISLPE
jgi:hypothetical protein